MAITFLGTTLDRSGSATHSGHVDLMDLRHGVRGWVLNLTDPSRPVSLELCMGAQVVALTQSATEREDISAKLGQTVMAGFQFDADAMDDLHGHLGNPDDVLRVRIGGTGLYLSGAEKALTAADIAARIRVETAPVRRNTTVDFEQMMEELQAEAGALAELALRAVREDLQGYIETVAVCSAGQLWFMGWMKRGHAQEFSAVMADRRKYPAAVAVMSYSRDDVPEGASGVVGLISSQWRPNSASGGLCLHFGAGGRFHLRSKEPLRVLASDELSADYEAIRDRCLGDGRSAAMQRMLNAIENWHPTRSPAQWHATETSVDRVLLVPGLGCFVEGWVLSPIKRIESLRLRVGSAVMAAHPENLFWKARPDLLASFPGAEHMIERAGYVGLFAGGAAPEGFADPVLKLGFEGGGSVNYSIAPKAFRRLGHSASVGDALLFFPALQEEAFFPAFAAAAIRAEQGATRAPVPISMAASRRCVVFVLPEHRCDIFLLFEEVAQQCRAGAGPEAVAFIAAAQSNRSDALWLFREFETTYGGPRGIACSLLVVDTASQAFRLLPDILSALGAERFVFVGSGVFLTDSGWARAREALADGAKNLEFFGLEAEQWGRRSRLDSTAQCFAWSAAQFTRWASTAPAFMGGFYRDNTLRSRTGQVMHADAARCARRRAPTQIEEAVNAAIYAH